MQEKLTPYLREQSRTNQAVELQFYKDPLEEELKTFPLMDPLNEKEIKRR